MRLISVLMGLLLPIMGSASSNPFPEGVEYSGTGFFVTQDGVFATAGHMIYKHSRLVVLYNGEFYNATLIDVDHTRDVAIAKINARTTPLGLALPKDGEKVDIYGYPLPEELGFNLKDYTARNDFDGEPWLTHVAKSITGAYTSCAGDSGGPVVNQNNQAVGVLTDGLDDSVLVHCSRHSGYRDISFIMNMMYKHGISYYSTGFSKSSIVIIYGVKK